MRTRLFAAFTLLALSSLASAARADEPVTAPNVMQPPKETTTRPQVGPAVAGGVLLGVSYTVGAVGGAMMDVCLNLFGSSSAGCAKPHWPMYIPVAGPFVALGTADAAGRLDGGSAAFMIADGVAQVGSLALLIYGLTARVPVQPKSVTVVPTASASGYGLAVAGTF